MEFSHIPAENLESMGFDLQKCRKLLFDLKVGRFTRRGLASKLRSLNLGFTDEFVTALLDLWEMDPILNGWESLRAQLEEDPSEEEYYRRCAMDPIRSWAGEFISMN